ncbi:MAG: glycosyltransferase family 2 protein [Bacteroidetes bacterium]|nr:glycosyltransferase family 2 protein [Bacteroidota bacterium]
MISSAPLVSVLMTSYCREKYIANAIESVLASTYVNFELIIVDDGSTDKTLEIAKDYAAKDKRVKVFINEKNLGDYPNRNKAASLANGKYLKYIDSDDYIYPHGLQVLVSMMEAYPEAGWGLCSLIQDIRQPFPLLLSPKEAYEYNYRGPGLFHKAPLSSIIRKDIFDQIGGFSEIRMVGDFDMWHKLAQKHPVLLMPDGIVWYREHNEQEINSRKKFAVTYSDVKFKYLLSPDCPLEKQEIVEILSAAKTVLVKQIIFYSLRLKYDIVKEHILLLKNHIKNSQAKR